MTYWIFIVYQSLLKKILKYLSGKIDKYRFYNSICKEKIDVISLNYYCEYYLSFYYLWFVKFYISFDLPPQNTFIFYLFIHFMTESIETNIMFTNFFYNMRQSLTKYVEKTILIINEDAYESNVNYNNVTSKIQLCAIYLLLKIVKDKSNLKEWRNRLSMDVIARLICTFLVIRAH